MFIAGIAIRHRLFLKAMKSFTCTGEKWDTWYMGGYDKFVSKVQDIRQKEKKISTKNKIFLFFLIPDLPVCRIAVNETQKRNLTLDL